MSNNSDIEFTRWSYLVFISFFMLLSCPGEKELEWKYCKFFVWKYLLKLASFHRIISWWTVSAVTNLLKDDTFGSNFVLMRQNLPPVIQSFCHAKMADIILPSKGSLFWDALYLAEKQFKTFIFLHLLWECKIAKNLTKTRTFCIQFIIHKWRNLYITYITKVNLQAQTAPYFV